MSKKVILYCHGFASAGRGEKSEALEQAYPDATVIAPDIPVNPHLAVKLFDDILEQLKDDQVVVVGTSLGGFWANAISVKYNVPCVLVNPSITPSITLKERLACTPINYATGELITISDHEFSGYEALEYMVNSSPRNGMNVRLVVAADDDVLDAFSAVSYFRSTYSTTVKAVGGHRFADDWDEIVNMVGNILAI